MVRGGFGTATNSAQAHRVVCGSASRDGGGWMGMAWKQARPRGSMVGSNRLNVPALDSLGQYSGPSSTGWWIHHFHCFPRPSWPPVELLTPWELSHSAQDYEDVLLISPSTSSNAIGTSCGPTAEPDFPAIHTCFMQIIGPPTFPHCACPFDFRPARLDTLFLCVLLKPIFSVLKARPNECRSSAPMNKGVRSTVWTEI